MSVAIRPSHLCRRAHFRFDDVVQAYKRKLEELKKLAEEDKRQEAADAANDVTKRKDMSDFYRNQFRVDGKGAAAVAADGDGGAGAADNSGGSAAGDSKAEGGADAIDGTEPGGGAGAGSDGAGGPSEFKRPMKRPNRGSRPGGSDNIAPTPPPFYFLSTREGLIISPYTGGTTYPAVSSLEAFQQFLSSCSTSHLC